MDYNDREVAAAGYWIYLELGEVVVVVVCVCVCVCAWSPQNRKIQIRGPRGYLQAGWTQNLTTTKTVSQTGTHARAPGPILFDPRPPLLGRLHADDTLPAPAPVSLLRCIRFCPFLIFFASQVCTRDRAQLRHPRIQTGRRGKFRFNWEQFLDRRAGGSRRSRTCNASRMIVCVVDVI